MRRFPRYQSPSATNSDRELGYPTIVLVITSPRETKRNILTGQHGAKIADELTRIAKANGWTVDRKVAAL